MIKKIQFWITMRLLILNHVWFLADLLRTAVCRQNFRDKAIFTNADLKVLLKELKHAPNYVPDRPYTDLGMMVDSWCMYLRYMGLHWAEHIFTRVFDLIKDEHLFTPTFINNLTYLKFVIRIAYYRNLIANTGN